MILHKTGMLALVAMTAVAAASAGDTAQDVLNAVKKKYDSITDAQLKFTQRSKFGLSKVEQKSSGTLLFKKRNMYRMELDDRALVTNGTIVWSYSALNNQVLVDKFKVDERMMTPEKLLTGAPGDFYATLIGTEKIGKSEVYVLKLLPKDDLAFVRSMKLWVDESTSLIKRVEYTDANDNETGYEVTDIKLNTGLADSRFAFDIPEGAEVVDLR